MEIFLNLQGDPATSEFSENDISNDDLLKLIDELQKIWVAPLSRYAALEAAERFGVKDAYENGSLLPTGDNGIETIYKKYRFGLVRVEFQLYTRNMVEIVDGNVMSDIAGTNLKQSIRKIEMAMTQLYRCLRDDAMTRKALDPTWATECPNILDDFAAYDETKLKKYGTFSWFVLQNLFKEGLARYNDEVYQQIMSPPLETSEGKLVHYNTHAWQRRCTIEEYIGGIIEKESFFNMYNTLLEVGIKHAISEAKYHLCTITEKQFPKLYPDRHWFAFRNGLYHTRHGQFFPYGQPGIPYNVVACKYHDLTFDTEVLQIKNWYDVPTVAVQSILEYQLEHLGELAMREVIMWVYAFLGRLLFELGERDGWQVIMFIMGRAGTGKSCLIDAVTSFFNDEDVAILANNSQKDFGLETFVDKLAWACYEVKHDLTLDQANFQSMVTGEKVSIARKHQKALTVLWKTPGILAGNEPGGWTDNSGSISRRVVTLKFERKVQSDKLDPLLDKKIKLETANLIHKCCLAYLTATEEYGDCDIWKEVLNDQGEKESILPRYFHIQKERMVELTHPVASLLRNCDTITIAPNVFMPFDTFQSLANDWFKANNYKSFNWGEKDKYTAVMEDFGVKRLKVTADFISKKTPNKQLNYNGRAIKSGTEIIMGVIEREFFGHEASNTE